MWVERETWRVAVHTRTHTTFYPPPPPHRGHDFRPDYKEIGAVRSARFPRVPITALTATAPRAVVDDVLKSLHMRDAVTFTVSFFRPNLTLRVMPKPSGRTEDGAPADLAAIADFVTAPEHINSTGIIYCLSRDDTETTAAFLRDEANVAAAHYHAGVSAGRRAAVQAAWQAGEVRVVVATIAFGMGIDKDCGKCWGEVVGGWRGEGEEEGVGARPRLPRPPTGFLSFTPHPTPPTHPLSPLCHPRHPVQVFSLLFPGSRPCGARRRPRRLRSFLQWAGRRPHQVPPARSRPRLWRQRPLPPWLRRAGPHGGLVRGQGRVPARGPVAPLWGGDERGAMWAGV